MPKSAVCLLGSHVSTSGGCPLAIERALSIGCTTMQIFVKNNMQWFATPLPASEAGAFRDHPRREELHAVFGHTGYLINLAATNPDFHARSIRSLREELARAAQLDLPFLVLHPGAHMGAGVDAGLDRVVSSLDQIFSALPDNPVRIALEVTAGQGTTLGRTFEELAFILDHVKQSHRLCVCLDTAHLFAGGHDISTTAGIKKTFAAFDKLIGPARLAALHLNDSKTPLGSRVDRHEHIGKGRIGLDPFRFIIRQPRFRKIPKVLETPKGKEMKEDIENMSLLRSLITE
jgi:deoxyribonuclease-4